MKIVRFHSIGGPEVLTYEDAPDPKPGPGEVLIKVGAAGVNFADVMRRRGDPYPETSPLPFTPGGEVAGTVAELGSGVTDLEIGATVYATSRVGGYAQYVVVPRASVLPIPNGLTASQAAGLVIQGLTALLALRYSARLAVGETVLVEAAAGGVGSFAVQLAKLMGAGKVIGLASSKVKRDIALSLGADAVVDYTKPGWSKEVLELTNGEGAQVILEMTGGSVLGEALESMASFGRMIVYGQASGFPTSIDPQTLTTKNHAVIGFYIAQFFATPFIIESALNELVDYVKSGKVKLDVGLELPLSHASEAHSLLENRMTNGKVVLLPWAEE
ncbi:quinone oxidoreductase family protein [Roseateles noduli]|uniref:quinone oxidoreductase family protein n=1 Tax=Roseateles noduli TaxID=2052484 RepID=UPI003D66049C